ncbi:hypothetical protein CW304_17320 [Bacillus sp. UFRGS-B20]|nr:hypothetical protein CW304_17320 [Bacillus sp. UFRGS-B20]
MFKSEGAMVFFFGGIFYTSVFMFFYFLWGAWSIIILSLTRTIVKIEIVFYIALQFNLFNSIFISKAVYKFQSYKRSVVLLYAFQLGQ